MQNKRHFLLGVLFTFSLSLLAAYTLFFTDTGNIFKEPIPLKVDFDDAYGLRVGDPVQFLGLRIGRVKSIEPDPGAVKERRIKTTLYLDTPIDILQGSLFTISDSTLLGGHQVNITPGEPGGPPMETVEGAYLGIVEGSPIASLGSVGDLVEENREAVRSILNTFDQILLDVRAGKGIVGRLLSDDEWAQEIDDTLASLSSTADKINRGEGALGALINDASIAKELRDAVSSINSVSGKIDKGEGVLGALINDPELTAKLKETFDSISTITGDIEAGKGLVGGLLTDQEMAAKFKGSIESLSNITTKLDTGRGLLALLISDEELGAELSTIVTSIGNASTDIEALVAKVRTGEGNLGKFLLDQELYDEALGAVKLLTQSLEDFREAAPVTAFTTVLFSGF